MVGWLKISRYFSRGCVGFNCHDSLDKTLVLGKKSVFWTLSCEIGKAQAMG